MRTVAGNGSRKPLLRYFPAVLLSSPAGDMGVRADRSQGLIRANGEQAVTDRPAPTCTSARGGRRVAKTPTSRTLNRHGHRPSAFRRYQPARGRSVYRGRTVPDVRPWCRVVAVVAISVAVTSGSSASAEHPRSAVRCWVAWHGR